MESLEIRIAEATPAFKRDLDVVFPRLPSKDLTVVFTFQDSTVELLDPNPHTEVKDRCLHLFFDFSKALGQRLEGYWWDYIDPCSGYPMNEEPAGLYSDVDACQRLLHMPLENIGNCWVISHPVFSTRVYIASFLTTAPRALVEAEIDELKAEGN